MDAVAGQVLWLPWVAQSPLEDGGTDRSVVESLV